MPDSLPDDIIAAVSTASSTLRTSSKPSVGDMELSASSSHQDATGQSVEDVVQRLLADADALADLQAALNGLSNDSLN